MKFHVLIFLCMTSICTHLHDLLIIRMGCESCSFWGHIKCVLPCLTKVKEGFNLKGLLIEPSVNDKLERDSKAIFISPHSENFREHCECEGDICLMDRFALSTIGKSVRNIDGAKLDLNLGAFDLVLVPRDWVRQYYYLEKYLRSCARNGHDRGLAYARKFARQLKHRKKISQG